MVEKVPSPRNSSELERGEVPEVAALGNALTALFNTLEVSQNAYAVRISMDKSIVSRYLRGRRVAPQDFIDRLLREVAARRGADVQPEVRAHLTQLRLGALKVCDPAAHELESLRAEMERSQRTVQRLARHQEALHDLLDKKESQVRSLQGELEQLRQDWVADGLGERHRETGERDRLVLEIARLKAELGDVSSLREDAERRCAELERRVGELEEELAGRTDDGSGSRLPLPALQEQLLAHWTAGEHGAAGRELAEAVLGRPVEELVELQWWLDERGDTLRRERLVRDVVHLRTVEEVAEFGHAAETRAAQESRANCLLVTQDALLAGEICAVMSPQDVAAVHRHWAAHWNGGDSFFTASGTLMRALLSRPGDLDGKVRTLLLFQADVESLEPFLPGCITSDASNLLAVAARASVMGHADLATMIWSAFVAELLSSLSSGMPFFHYSWGLTRWPEDDLRALADSILDSLPPHEVLLVMAALHSDRFGSSDLFGSQGYLHPVFRRIVERGRLAELRTLAQAEVARGGSDTAPRALPAWAEGVQEALAMFVDPGAQAPLSPP
ncbi:hypothetical protein ACYF6T_17890 [Streptomyces sp. 7R007]